MVCKGAVGKKGIAFKQLVKQRDGAFAWEAVLPALVPQLSKLLIPPDTGSSLLTLQQHFETVVTGFINSRCNMETNKKLLGRV